MKGWKRGHLLPFTLPLHGNQSCLGTLRAGSLAILRAGILGMNIDILLVGKGSREASPQS